METMALKDVVNNTSKFLRKKGWKITKRTRKRPYMIDAEKDVFWEPEPGV